MKKRFISMLMALAMLMSFVPVIVSAETSGTCGESVTWMLDDNGTLTIRGKGDMITDGNAPWNDNRYDVKKVVIENGVTSIDVKAFYDCINLTSATIPASVTSIGNAAFFWCSALTSITIPARVTSIGDDTFYHCESLTSITIPDGVTSIGATAFASCSSLTSITIPDSVKSINGGAFANTGYYMNKENWENGVLYIGNHVIATKPSEISSQYKIRENTKAIAGNAFKDCSGLTSITIPAGVTSIGFQAFANCSGLTEITIPASVTSIGEFAFDSCYGLTSITIPAGVTSIGYGAFWNCNSLTDVYYSGTKVKWNAISIGESNELLTNATIHYNSTAPIPTPTPAPTPIPVTTAEITRTDSETDTSYTFEVDAESKYEDCDVYAAIYDENDRLLAVNRVPLETEGKTSISMGKNANAGKAKVFVWAKTLQSIIDKAKEFPLI